MTFSSEIQARIDKLYRGNAHVELTIGILQKETGADRFVSAVL